ncbi:alpha/beta fold hydrolase [Deinococcus maricopensis]|uniref:Homoserine O-acetyltransferase n=1 Tax=Deinococcus maricopensis (strain DSM 21211 / LMG 22137 / NRRL B-23946 / LB-34) TaxID=709986 RepID=E8UAT8_DEIML|nr:alpha/beta fold hydrolase [Deinococcus maricopensis]ADV68177.1 Homoserine O-acetyltransferase [Deinococcus maricopensis DSM 21211]
MTATTTHTFTFETTHALGGPAPLPVRLQVETYGTLNAARDNAVLVCHYYTGTMHAAGGGHTPGWWDALIGDDLAVDTRRYFVVCMNTPSNVQALDPRVVTTGPDSPDVHGRRYGERFPAWDLGDLFELQCALMRHLRVPAWHAVLGPSFGGIQALQWAARAPQLAPRVGALVASPYAGPVLQQAFLPTLWEVARAGGVEGALRLISFYGLGAEGVRQWFEQEDFAAYVRARGGAASLAHILDIGRVVGTHDLRCIAPPEALFERWRAHGTRLLSVNVLSDLFFPASEMRAFARAAAAAGVAHTHVEVDSDLGHLACLHEPEKFAPHLRALLSQ